MRRAKYASITSTSKSTVRTAAGQIVSGQQQNVGQQTFAATTCPSATACSG